MIKHVGSCFVLVVLVEVEAAIAGVLAPRRQKLSPHGAGRVALLG